jgi:hypothetical protein
MTQCVVYIDTPIRGEAPRRSYVNEAGSLGMWETFYEADRHLHRMFTMDSRVIVFASPKEAEHYAQLLANANMVGNSRDTYGYHGITENGNACAPFKVVRTAEPDNIVARMIAAHKYQVLHEAYSNCFLPWPINVTQVSIGRVGNIEWDDMMGQVSHWLDNMVDEEREQALIGLARLKAAEFQITAIEEHEESVDIHASRASEHTTEILHYCATLCAFNLWDAAGIAMLKDLRKRNEANVGAA